ncbi:protein cereblon [Athalia rosae]|uniref:protein cereblon n=1 Tax=Athalia rosae TaxID=37344 RepID=UPI002033A22A|nr:protein cereblon [Athalia rosae]
MNAVYSDDSSSSDENDSDVQNFIQETNLDQSMEDDSTLPPTNSTFDLTLPATHSYLGNNLEDVRGRTILDDGIYMNLPLLVKQSVVLFPGQTLPMTVRATQTIDMLQKCIEKNRTFGVVCLGNEGMLPIGTTAEIFQYKHDEQSPGFRVKAKGRQRFKILHVIQGYDKISANVKILPEISLRPPLFDERLLSLDRLRITPSNKQEAMRQQNIERHDAILSHWPSWVYRQYDSKRLSIRIRHHLQYIEMQGSNIPEDPTELSFWVAQNLLLDDKERIVLLTYDCAIPRLRWELEYLVKDRLLTCSSCDDFIGKQSDVFPMNKEGPQSAYCNPAGIIHETVTLYKAQGLILNDEVPQTEYSWFPGYAWTIALCKGCHGHMGWKFTAVHSDLRPQAFWGLTRKSLRSKEVCKCRLASEFSDSDDETS